MTSSIIAPLSFSKLSNKIFEIFNDIFNTSIITNRNQDSFPNKYIQNNICYLNADDWNISDLDDK